MDTLHQERLPSVSKLMQEAWGRLRAHFVTLVKLEAIIWGIAFLGSLALYFFAEKVVQVFPGGIIGTAWFFAVIGLVLRIAVSVAQIRVLISDNPVSLPSAWSHGMRRLIPVAGYSLALFLMSLPVVLAMMLFIIASAGLTPTLFGADSAEAIGDIAAVSGTVFLALIPVYVFLAVRFSFVCVLAAIGETAGAFKESWSLTGGKFWAVFWRIAAATLAFGFLSMAASGVLDVVFSSVGDSESGSTAISAVSSILKAVIQSFFTIITMAYWVSLLKALQGKARA